MILAFVSISYYIGKYSLPLEVLTHSKSAPTQFLFISFAILGTFFAFILFSGILSKDIESEAIRYVLPYIKRYQLVLSKYLAMVIYLILLLSVSFIIIVLRGKVVFPFHEFFNMICFFAYILALVILLSTVLNERMSFFVGIIAGFALPILGGITGMASNRNNLGYKIVSYFLPFRYIKANWDILILLAISAVLLGLTIYLFNVKEV